MVPLAKKVMNGDAEVIRLMALITLYLAEYIDTSMMKVEWIASKCIQKTLKSQMEEVRINALFPLSLHKH